MATNKLEYDITSKNDGFKKAMKENLESVKTLDKAFEGVNKKISGGGGLTESIAKGIGIERIAERAFDKIMEFGKGVIEASLNYEKFSARLSTLLNGNKEEAEVLHQQLVELSSVSGIKLGDIEEASIQLNIFGVSAGEITESLKHLGEISIATGIDLKTLSEQYGRIVETGNLTNRTLRSFQKEGVNLQAQLQKDLHLSAEAFDKLLKKGQITAEEVNKALTEMTTAGGQFAGQMEAQLATTGGKIAHLGVAWEELKINIGRSQTGLLGSTLSFVNSLVDSLNRGEKAMSLISESFKKYGAQDFNFYEKYIVSPLSKIGMMFGMHPVKGGYAEEQEYASSMEKQFYNPEGGKGETLKNISSLSNIIANLYQDKTLSDKERQRSVSILQGIIDEDKSLLKLISEKKPDKKEGAGAPSEKETTRESITINIDKLVETIELHTTNLKESAGEIKNIIAEVLQEAVYSTKYAGH